MKTKSPLAAITAAMNSSDRRSIYMTPDGEFENLDPYLDEDTILSTNAIEIYYLYSTNDPGDTPERHLLRFAAPKYLERLRTVLSEFTVPGPVLISAYKALDTLADEIRNLANQHGGVIYARYGHKKYDAKPGYYSVNHANGNAENGLSVNTITATDSNEKIISCLTEYSFLRTSANRLTLYSGTPCGIGSDGEDVICNQIPLATLKPTAERICDMLSSLRRVKYETARTFFYSSFCHDRITSIDTLSTYQTVITFDLAGKTPARVASIIKNALTYHK